jgi:hypothetical protein
MFYRTFVAPELKAAHGNVHQRGAGVENLDIRSDNLPPAMLATFPTVRYPTTGPRVSARQRPKSLVEQAHTCRSSGLSYICLCSQTYGRVWEVLQSHLELTFGQAADRTAKIGAGDTFIRELLVAERGIFG